MSDWTADELEALERGAPMSVMAQIRARREVRAAAGKVSPESVNFGPALGLERCGVCAHYLPSSNPMTGACAVVDKYRVERNTWCERYQQPDPDTFGAPGGAVAEAAQRFYAMATSPRPSQSALLASNQALLGRVRMHRDSVDQRYGWNLPKVFARWLGDGS